MTVWMPPEWVRDPAEQGPPPDPRKRADAAAAGSPAGGGTGTAGEAGTGGAPRGPDVAGRAGVDTAVEAPAARPREQGGPAGQAEHAARTAQEEQALPAAQGSPVTTVGRSDRGGQPEAASGDAARAGEGAPWPWFTVQPAEGHAAAPAPTRDVPGDFDPPTTVLPVIRADAPAPAGVTAPTNPRTRQDEGRWPGDAGDGTPGDGGVRSGAGAVGPGDPWGTGGPGGGPEDSTAVRPAGAAPPLPKRIPQTPPPPFGVVTTPGAASLFEAPPRGAAAKLMRPSATLPPSMPSRRGAASAAEHTPAGRPTDTGPTRAAGLWAGAAAARSATRSDADAPDPGIAGVGERAAAGQPSPVRNAVGAEDLWTAAADRAASRQPVEGAPGSGVSAGAVGAEDLWAAAADRTGSRQPATGAPDSEVLAGAAPDRDASRDRAGAGDLWGAATGRTGPPPAEVPGPSGVGISGVSAAGGGSEGEPAWREAVASADRRPAARDGAGRSARRQPAAGPEAGGGADHRDDAEHPAAGSTGVALGRPSRYEEDPTEVLGPFDVGMWTLQGRGAATAAESAGRRPVLPRAGRLSEKGAGRDRRQPAAARAGDGGGDGGSGGGGRPPTRGAPGSPPRSSTARDRLRTLLRGTGQTLITLGLVLLLFSVYEVWFTGIVNGRTQHRLKSELEKRWEQGDDPVVAGQKPGRPPARVRSIPLGDGFALIYIPAFGKDYVYTVVEGTDPNELDEGPGHYVQTALPGQVGNFAIAGHRVGKGSPFLNLDKLRAGSPIVIRTKAYWYTYRVLGNPATNDPRGIGPLGIPGLQIVSPGEVDVIAPVPGHPGLKPTRRLLTLTTCHPKFSARQRLVIHAQLDGAPRPTSQGLPSALAGGG